MHLADVQGSGCIDPRFLGLTLILGLLLASRSGRFTPGERAHRHTLDRKLGGPQSFLDDTGKIKKFFALPGLEPRHLTGVQI
jgi:hypothetical protein